MYTDFDNKNIKSHDLINCFEHSDSIENSKVIISHQRFSTSGFELKYNHPFENKNFVMVHNGVIDNFKLDKGSDTHGFFERFNTEFVKIKTMAREKAIVAVIKFLFKDNRGSYSILIYDKVSKLSYYFKNSPEIHFYKNKNYLFISTIDDNKIFLPILDKTKFVELEINPRVIYRIDKLFEVYKIAEWKDKVVSFDFEEEKGIEKESLCDFCNKPITKIYQVSATENVCESCYWNEVENIQGTYKNKSLEGDDEY